MLHFFYQKLKMTSILLDKLEALKSNEIKLKEDRRVLEEQIALEMEKKRRLKMDATLIKLEVQVDELVVNSWSTAYRSPAEKFALCQINDNNKYKFVPLFRTLIGIMEKQQREINELKKQQKQ
tara:strand:+ start:2513 stop:2881 length:369 start_codon:yes stop_codon:yes gene_type:complete